jgi:hypothetical protein
LLERWRPTLRIIASLAFFKVIWHTIPMSREHLIEAGLAAQLIAEADTAEISYTALRARHEATAEAIADILLPQIMYTVAPPDKEPDTRYALCWLLDGDVSDNELNFATRVAFRIRPAPEDIKPKHVTPPADALVRKKYIPAKRWSEEAKRLGNRGLFLTGIDAIKKTPLVVMEREEPVKNAIGWAQFTHLSGGGARYKANPDEPEAEHQTVRPLPAFDSVLATAYGSFVVSHAQEILDEPTKHAFAEAAERDRRVPAPGFDLPLRLREASRDVPDAMRRLDALAGLTYTADADVMNPALLMGLLNPSVAQIASLARMDSGAYHILRSRQPDRAGLFYRLGWIQDNAPLFQNVMRARMNSDAAGFAALLKEQTQAAGQAVADAEKLRAHLEPPDTMQLQPADWLVVRAH